MKSLALLSVLCVVGCDVAPRPVARKRANDIVERMTATEEAIERAKNDPDVSEEEFKLIQQIETVRGLLAVQKATRSEELPNSMALSRDLTTLMLVALQDLRDENETNRETCLTMAEGAESDYPSHARALRRLARQLSTSNKILDIKIHRLKKQLR